ncbi:MAG: hypothetical protein ABEJ60_00050 [Halodesulfurarchaeum sp.]
MPATIPLSDLALGAYCPRKLYYARRTERSPPEEYETALALSRRYGAFLAGEATPPADELALDPAPYCNRLAATRASTPRWADLRDPDRTAVFLSGKDVHGRAAKVLADPPEPAIVSPGAPPPDGVWQPQAVRAVGAAKALSWEESTPVERAFVEYPRHGVIRPVPLTTRRTAAYRRTLRVVQSLDGPPPRVSGDAKCETCRFADRCGTRSRSLASLLSRS